MAPSEWQHSWGFSPDAAPSPFTFVPDNARTALPLDVVQSDFAIAGRALKQDYDGYVARVKRLGGDVRDVRTAQDADNFGANRVVGWYEQNSGDFLAYGSDRGYENQNGIIGAKNLDGSDSSMALPTATKNMFNATSGGFVAVAMSGFGSASSGRPNENIFRVSSASSSTARQLLRINGSGGFEAGGRMVDSNATQLFTNGGEYGRSEVMFLNFDYTTAALEFWRLNGARTLWPYQTAGTGEATNPAEAIFDIPSGCTLTELIVKASPMAVVDREVLASSYYGYYNRSVNDGIQSWWTDVAAKHPSLPLTLLGWTSAAGHQGISEINNATGAILNQVTLEVVRYALRDDHNSVAPIYLSDGTLLVFWTQHSNSVIGAAGNGRIMVRKYPSGRISGDFVDQALPSTLAKANYLQPFFSKSRVGVFTNDDSGAKWLTFTSDNSGDSWVQNRGLVNLTGMINSNFYFRSAQISTTAVRIFSIPHPYNIQNSIRLCELNPETGHFTAGGTVLGNAFEGSTTIVNQSSLPIVYTPPSGKSCRLLGVSPDGTMIGISEHDNHQSTEPVENATHYLITYSGQGNIWDPANWSGKIELGPATSVFQTYVGTLEFAKDARNANTRLYRNWKDGSEWKLDQLDSSDGFETYTTQTIYSTPDILLRSFAPRNAASSLPILQTEMATYGSSGSWRSRFATVIPPTEADSAPSVDPDPFEAETVALLARMTVQPSVDGQAAINACIAYLKTAGVWAKLDLLRVHRLHDTQSSLLNWIKNEHNATIVGSPTFTPQYGFTGDGVAACLNSGFTPSGITKYQQNDAFMGVWLGTNAVSTTQTDFGNERARINARRTNLTAAAQSNATSAAFVEYPIPAATAVGWTFWNRSSSTQIVAGKNDVEATYAHNTAATAYPMYELARGLSTGLPSSFSTKQIWAAVLGQGLSAGERLAIYEGLNELMMALGS